MVETNSYMDTLIISIDHAIIGVGWGHCWRGQQGFKRGSLKAEPEPPG